MIPPAADGAPILIFDSGVGGLTVLEATRRLLPDVPVVYAADHAGLPYGTKSEAEIAARVPALLGRLVERYRPAIVTIACNTASTIALSAARAALDLPVVGTVPAIKPAAALSGSRVIGLLGTQATIRQPYVDRLAAEFAADCTLIRYGAPELVAAAEAKLRGETVDPFAIVQAVNGLAGQQDGGRIDTVVLACTHFPLLADELADAFPFPVRFVDGADGIARRIAWLIGEGAEVGHGRTGTFVTTAPLASAEPYRPALARFGLTGINSLASRTGNGQSRP